MNKLIKTSIALIIKKNEFMILKKNSWVQSFGIQKNKSDEVDSKFVGGWNLESCWTPVNELDSLHCFNFHNGRINIIGCHIASIE